MLIPKLNLVPEPWNPKPQPLNHNPWTPNHKSPITNLKPLIHKPLNPVSASRMMLKTPVLLVERPFGRAAIGQTRNSCSHQSNQRQL